MKTILLALIVALDTISHTHAATFTVTNVADSGVGSLRQAIVSANSSAGPDTIAFSDVSGTITLGSALPAITDDVTISGPGAGDLTVSGGNVVRILTVAAGKAVQISSLTFAQGAAPLNAHGGAIENYGIVTVSDSIFINNRTSGGFGGAIYNAGGLTLINTTFTNNRAVGGSGSGGNGGGGFGGGIFSMSGSLFVRQCTFMGNNATGEGGGGSGGAGGSGFGSAIYVAGGSGSISYSKFLQNTASGGGGTFGSEIPLVIPGSGGVGMGAVFLSAGSLVVEDSTFQGNAALGGRGGGRNTFIALPGNGGASRGAAITNNGGTLVVRRSTINLNQTRGGSGGSAARGGSVGGSAVGGGIACLNGSSDFTNTTISENTAVGGDGYDGGTVAGTGGSANGGGLAIVGGSATLTNCTVATNRVQPGVTFPYVYAPPELNARPGQVSGGGIFASTVLPALKNNLFSGNLQRIVIRNSSGAVVSTTDTPFDGSGAIASQGHNLFTTYVIGLVASDLRNIAAPLGPLQDNGGSTYTQALPAGSPALDAGDNAGAPATDQRGVPRPQGGAADIGAYEAGNGLLISVDGGVMLTGPVIRNAPVNIGFQATFPTGAILYTLNGSVPTLASKPYTGLFTLTNSATIRAIAYSSDFTSSVLAGPLNISLLIPRTLTVTTTGSGTVAVNPPNTGPYPADSVVSVVATPATGWQFVSWLGDLENASATNAITMSRNKNIEAVFGTPLQTNVIGSGTVSHQPDLPLYPAQSVVRLFAIPASGSYFSFWSNPINSTANSVDFSIVNPNPSVVAVFAALGENEFAFNVLTDGAGTVVASPAGTHFANGTMVQLLAKPAAGQAFLGWSGDASGGNPAINVLVNSSKTVSAHFTKLPVVSMTADSDLFRAEGARLVLRGEAGNSYQILSAQTLTGQFILIGTVTNSFGTVQFLDPGASSLGQRFYRALVAP